eukprot:226801_1
MLRSRFGFLRSSVKRTGNLSTHPRPLQLFGSCHFRSRWSLADLKFSSLFSEKVPYGFKNFKRNKKSKDPTDSKSPAKPRNSSEQNVSGKPKKPSKTNTSDTPSTSSKKIKKDSSKKESSGSTKKRKKSSERGGGGPLPPGDDELWEMLKKYKHLLIPIPFYLLWTAFKDIGQEETSFQDFSMNILPTGMVKDINVRNDSIAVATMKNVSGTEIPQQYVFTICDAKTFKKELDFAQRKLGLKDYDFIPVTYSKSSGSMLGSLSALASFAVSIAFLGFFMTQMRGGKGGGKGGGIGQALSMFKSQATVINKGEKCKTKFTDVAGLGSAKEELSEFVNFMKEKEKFVKLGAKIPKGALLVGPPGTGKTLLAKAVAGETDAPFFSVSGSDFVEMFVGVGSSRVRDLFEQARANAPCIIFIDEIDAIGRARGKGNGGGDSERENTLNQLLVEMDGFKSTSGIVVLAGTNRADILDKALMRPGRFDRQVQVGLPNVDERIEIFKVHIRPLTMTSNTADVAARMAQLTPGMSGADIANVCNEAAIVAARAGKDGVTLDDFNDALDRVIGGLKTSRTFMNEQEKRTIAYHEAGHAVAGWFTEFADPLLKVTVIPRTSGTLGFAQYLNKEVQMFSKQELLDRMVMAFGGRVAEMLFFNKLSTGAQNDLEKITNIAYGQVRVYGMGDDVGHLSFPVNQQSAEKPFSEYLSEKIDREVNKMVNECYGRTMELLTEKKEQITVLAEKLLEVETLTHDDVVSLLGPRPFQTDDYTDFLKRNTEFHDKLNTESDTENVTSSEEAKVTPESKSENTEKPSEKDSETNEEKVDEIEKEENNAK